ASAPLLLRRGLLFELVLEVGLLDVVEGDPHAAAGGLIGHVDSGLVDRLETAEPCSPRAFRRRRLRANPYLAAEDPPEMLDPRERATQTRRGNFEHVPAAQNLVRFETVAEALAHRLAVVGAHAPRLIGAVQQHTHKLVRGRARQLDIEDLEAP